MLDPDVQADIMLDKIYSNMSQCHIKRENWKRAMETADKVRPSLYEHESPLFMYPIFQALAKNSLNTKALFRKGKALGELGQFEKSQKILDDLLTKNLPGASLA